ncbi:MAG: hypothetical protein WB507_00535 [Solirubrobacterales bacterium]
MSRRLCQIALSLYPLAFRRRYGEEMRSLVDEEPARAPAAIDLLRGALAAHLRPPTAAAGLIGPSDRVRASLSGVLACWVLFAAAGFGFYKTTEETAFRAAAHAHPLLGGAHLAILVAALVASATVALGASPLIAAALAEARRRGSLRALLGLPALSLVLFAGLTAALALLARSHASVGLGGVAFIAWGIAGLACAAVCVLASRAALFAVPLAPWRLLAALAGGTLLSAAMAVITLATAAYAIALPLQAPHLAAASNGPLGVLSVTASLLLQVIVMVAAGTLAAITTRRGWRVAAQLDASAPG